MLRVNQARAPLRRHDFIYPLEVWESFSMVALHLTRPCADRAQPELCTCLLTQTNRSKHDADDASRQGSNQLRHERGQHHVPGLHFQGGENRNAAGGGSTCGETVTSRLLGVQRTSSGCRVLARNSQ